MEPQVIVDFGEVRDDKRLFSLARNVNPHICISAGVRLLLGDGVGNVCYADVVSFKGGLLELQLDDETFQAAPANTPPEMSRR